MKNYFILNMGEMNVVASDDKVRARAINWSEKVKHEKYHQF